jgi:hypothetical protein
LFDVGSCREDIKVAFQEFNLVEQTKDLILFYHNDLLNGILLFFDWSYHSETSDILERTKCHHVTTSAGDIEILREEWDLFYDFEIYILGIVHSATPSGHEVLSVEGKQVVEVSEGTF